MILKVIVWSAAPAVGWRGAYFMDGTRLVLFKAGLRTQPSRVDRRIFFQHEALDLHFLNDLRYNDNRSGRLRHFEYPLRIEWSGYVYLDAAATVRIQLACAGRAKVLVDGLQAFDFDLDAVRGPSEACHLSPGRHQLLVTYEKPAFHGASVGLQLLAGDRELVASPTAKSAERARLWVRWARGTDLLGASAVLLLAAVLVWAYGPLASLATCVRRISGGAAVTAVFGLLLLVSVSLKVVPLGMDAANLGSGDDPLAYEAFAVSHLASMVLAAPWTCGHKTILPLRAMFLFAAVYLFAPARVSQPEGVAAAGRSGRPRSAGLSAGSGPIFRRLHASDDLHR